MAGRNSDHRDDATAVQSADVGRRTDGSDANRAVRIEGEQSPLRAEVPEQTA
jgi:hypothetical protein